MVRNCAGILDKRRRNDGYDRFIMNGLEKLSFIAFWQANAWNLISSFPAASAAIVGNRNQFGQIDYASAGQLVMKPDKNMPNSELAEACRNRHWGHRSWHELDRNLIRMRRFRDSRAKSRQPSLLNDLS
jgi:hypothetical protein